MAKTDAELQALEQPQSRSEEFLNYLCGRALDINTLPIPQGRIEEFLEYLCHNGGIGGGGGGLTESQVQAMINKLLLVLSADENFLQLVGVNNQVLSNIPLMTQQQVQEIKNLFV